LGRPEGEFVKHDLILQNEMGYAKLAVQSVSVRQFMQRDEVVKILRQHWATLNSLGIRSLSIFGSVARDEARSSDIDVLVEFEPPITFDRYMDVKIYLEDHLGTRVDLVSWRSLKPQIQTIVEQEAIRVA
jgi:predicted nucleotidyltransferase